MQWGEEMGNERNRLCPREGTNISISRNSKGEREERMAQTMAKEVGSQCSTREGTLETR